MNGLESTPEGRCACDATELMAQLWGRTRKNTLVEVWDQLMKAGNLDGANTVRDMMRGSA